METGLDTILKTNAAVESVRQAYDGLSDRPREEWVRGTCPKCGEVTVANCYYVGGKYLIVHECWASLSEYPTCSYRKCL